MDNIAQFLAKIGINTGRGVGSMSNQLQPTGGNDSSFGRPLPRVIDKPLNDAGRYLSQPNVEQNMQQAQDTWLSPLPVVNWAQLLARKAMEQRQMKAGEGWQ